MSHVAALGRSAVAITSFNTSFMRSSKWQNTIMDPDLSPPVQPLPLVVYYEGGAYAGGDVLSLSTCAIDLFAAQPWLHAFTNNMSAFDAYFNLTKWHYKNGFLARPKLRHFEAPTFLVRKMAAMYDAVHKLPLASLVIWMDVDAVFNQPLDDEFFAFSFRHDVITIARLYVAGNARGKNKLLSLHSPETGVVSLQVTDRTRRFTALALQLYQGGLLQLFSDNCATLRPGCELLGFNDVQIYRLLVSGACDDYTQQLQHIQGCARWLVQNLSVGWFSAGCVAQEPSGLLWVQLAGRYPPGRYFCPGLGKQLDTIRSGSISPFNVLKYIAHLKGGNGMMTERALQCYGHFSRAACL